ncbi:TetR/AcrR family transcriptional regulator [Sphingomonas bacterium]|uniref:TetR/AcrR family transcriptional regulator n=1 Tax=Sphingomonas bacterium TaxID=1895847 RepID=UPI001575A9A4|nr:TetR/AcrR family transcriptional regulator [Sphingomonas bacterium]
MSNPAKTPSRLTELLNNAVVVLNERGISQTSLADIADDLGISRAALYYYIEDLPDLVFQCYRLSCERMSASLAHEVRSGGTELSIIAQFIAVVLAPDADKFASLSEIGYLREPQREVILGLYDGMLAQLAGLISKGVSSGRLRSCDPWIAANTIVSLLFWTPLTLPWSAGKRFSDVTLPTALSDFVLHGVLTGPRIADELVPVPFDELMPSSKGLFDKEYLTNARREALLRAASRLFNGKGIDATSLDEIAESVGATKRAILHYFGDKQGLVEQAYKRSFAIASLIPVSLVNKSVPPATRLASACAADAEAYLDVLVSPLTARAGFRSLRQAVQSDLEALSLDLREQYRALVSQAQDAGVLRAIDGEAFLLLLPGAFAWLSRGTLDVDRSDRHRIAREISDLLMHGIGRSDLGT